MTLKEALTTKAISLSLTGAELDLALIEAELDGSSDYTPATQAKALDLVYAGLLLSAIHITEVREDDVAIKRAGDLRGIYSAIMRKWGLADPFAAGKPSVRQITPW